MENKRIRFDGINMTDAETFLQQLGDRAVLLDERGLVYRDEDGNIIILSPNALKSGGTITYLTGHFAAYEDETSEEPIRLTDSQRTKLSDLGYESILDGLESLGIEIDNVSLDEVLAAGNNANNQEIRNARYFESNGYYTGLGGWYMGDYLLYHNASQRYYFQYDETSLQMTLKLQHRTHYGWKDNSVLEFHGDGSLHSPRSSKYNSSKDDTILVKGVADGFYVSQDVGVIIDYTPTTYRIPMWTDGDNKQLGDSPLKYNNSTGKIDTSVPITYTGPMERLSSDDLVPKQYVDDHSGGGSKATYQSEGFIPFQLETYQDNIFGFVYPVVQSAQHIFAIGVVEVSPFIAKGSANFLTLALQLEEFKTGLNERTLTVEVLAYNRTLEGDLPSKVKSNYLPEPSKWHTLWDEFPTFPANNNNPSYYGTRTFIQNTGKKLSEYVYGWQDEHKILLLVRIKKLNTDGHGHWAANPLRSRVNLTTYYEL